VPDADTARQLDKIGDVLTQVHHHLFNKDKSNAALHMSQEVRPAPLTTAVAGALHDCLMLRDKFKED